MRPSPESVPVVGFVSLGCPKNLVDTEHMASVLVSDHIPLASSPETADIVIVNTCAFINDAKRESVAAILEVCRMKKHGKCRAVIVAGCLPQRNDEALLRSLDGVDAFIGLDELDSVPGLVRDLARGVRKRVFRVSARAKRLFEPPGDGILFTGGPYAYLKIAEGCNHRCAFCAIPAIRGRYRSRRIGDIVKQAERLLERGVRELNLISQDTTRYGMDLRDGSDLPKLLRSLGSLGGKFWIRLLYGHPAHVTDGLLAAINEVPQVCRYLDLPVQHSHPEILRAMGRPDTSRGSVRAMPARIRDSVHGITLRTTCLVGFPGETRAHFADLLAFIREAEFDRLGVFTYSREKGTAAVALPMRVSARTAAGRREKLMFAQQEIVAKKALELVGREDDILVERRAGGEKAECIGRSARHAPEVDGEVRVSGVPRGLEGCFVKARYVGADGYDMIAAYTRKA